MRIKVAEGMFFKPAPCKPHGFAFSVRASACTTHLGIHEFISFVPAALLPSVRSPSEILSPSAIFCFLLFWSGLWLTPLIAEKASPGEGGAGGGCRASEICRERNLWATCCHPLGSWKGKHRGGRKGWEPLAFQNLANREWRGAEGVYISGWFWVCVFFFIRTYWYNFIKI